MFLGSEIIKKLILEKEMIKGYGNLEEQLQPNGFDLRVEKVQKQCSNKLAAICIDYKDLPDMRDVAFEAFTDKWILGKGAYLIYFMEEIHLPKDIAAITIQRSTVMRCLEETIVGSWDAGYHGKGCNKLTIDSTNGLLLQKGSRIVQMHFIPVAGESFGYNGNYQGENLSLLEWKCKNCNEINEYPISTDIINTNGTEYRKWNSDKGIYTNEKYKCRKCGVDKDGLQ
jgi:dUTP pyrophosphatase